MSSNVVSRYEKDVGSGSWLFCTPPTEEIPVRVDDAFGDERDVAVLLDTPPPIQDDNPAGKRIQSFVAPEETPQNATDAITSPYTEPVDERNLGEVQNESQDLWILRSDWLELGGGILSGLTDIAHSHQNRHITMPRAAGSLTPFTNLSRCESGPSLTHLSGGQVYKSHPTASTSVQSTRQSIPSPTRAQIRSSVLLAHLTGYSSSEDEDINLESVPQDIAPRSHPGHTQETLSHQQHTTKRSRPAKPSSKAFKSAEFVTSESESEADTVARHPTATANRATISSRDRSARSSESTGNLSLSASTGNRLKLQGPSNGPKSMGGSHRPAETTMKRQQPTLSITPLGASKRVKTRGGFVDESDNSDSGSEPSEQCDPYLSKSTGLEGQHEAEDGGGKDDWDSVPPSPPPPKRLPLDGRTIPSSSVPLPAKGVNVSRLRMLLGRKEKIPVANRNSLHNVVKGHAATPPKNGLKPVPAPAAKFSQLLTRTSSSTQSLPPLAQRATAKQSSLPSNARTLSGGSLLGPKKSTPSTPQSSPAQAIAGDATPTTTPTLTSTRLTDNNKQPHIGARPAEARVPNAAKLGTLQTPRKKSSQASNERQGPIKPPGSDDKQTAPPKRHPPSITKIPRNAGLVNDLIHSIREGDQQLVNEESHSSAVTRRPSDLYSAHRTQKRKAEGITGEPKGSLESAKKTRTVQTHQSSNSPTSETQGKPTGGSESPKVPLQPTTATTSAKAVLQNTAPEATLTCVVDLIDPTPQDLLQPPAIRVETTSPAPTMPGRLPQNVSQGFISTPTKADRMVELEPASTVVAVPAPSSAPATEQMSVESLISPQPSVTVPSRSPQLSVRNDSTSNSANEACEVTPSSVAIKSGRNDGSTNAVAPVAHKRKLFVKEVFQQVTAGSGPTKSTVSEQIRGIEADVLTRTNSPTPNRDTAGSSLSKLSISEQNQGTEPVNREDVEVITRSSLSIPNRETPASGQSKVGSNKQDEEGTEAINIEVPDVITLSTSPKPNTDAEPFFEYPIFQKIWSHGQEENDVAESEMTTRPFTCIREANVRAEKLFDDVREQFEQHFQVRFDQMNSKFDDHDCFVRLGMFAPISYASKTSYLKIWVQRDFVSKHANQTARSLKHTSFVSKTIYVLRLFKVIEPVTECDNDASNEAIQTVRVYHSVPCTEAYTTLEAANRAAHGLEIEMSHEKNPKECMRSWYDKERKRLNSKLKELNEHAGEKIEGSCWNSKFNGCDDFNGDKFELVVEKVGLCGPRNL